MLYYLGRFENRGSPRQVLLEHGVWQYWGRTLLSSSLATWQQLFGQDKHRWALVGYLVHLFFNRQRFRADDFQIPQHRQARSLAAI